MESYEVAVIGAGPAGSTCARILAHLGMSVLLLDREEFPREKPCAGWITPAVFQKLQVDSERYRQGYLLQDIATFRTGLVYGREIETRYDKTVSFGIRRWEFDRYLVELCSSAKSLGEQVASLERTREGWLINGRIKAAVVVGAGGNHCPVARALGAKPASESIIAAMVTEFELPEERLAESDLPPGVPVLCFTEDLRGYGWLVRKQNYINVGLGSMRVHDIHGQAERFCRYMLKKYRLGEREDAGLRGHAYLPYAGNAGRKIVDDGALLIGDAAGLSYPESGEGILPAVESAVLAAEAIRSARGEYRRERLESYLAELRQHFAGKEVSGFELPQSIRKIGGAIVLSNKYLTRKLVLDKWLLHIEQ